jgi:hypothetical protein
VNGNMKKTMVGVGMLILMGAILYWDERQTKQDQANQELKNRAMEFVAPDVSTVSIVNREPALTITLARTEDGIQWKLVAPVNAVAESTVVDNLLKTMLEFKFEKVVSQDQSRLADFGLDQPTRIVRLEHKGGSKSELIIGKAAPVGYSVYFQVGGKPDVMIGSQYLITATAKTLQEFRSKKILEVEAKDVASMGYVVGGERVLSLEQRNDVASMTYPKVPDANAAELKDFVLDVVRLRAEGFVDGADGNFLKSFETAKGKLQIKLKTVAAKEIVLDVSPVKEDFYVRKSGDPTFFKIGSDSIKTLTREISSFRNREILSFEITDVERIELDGQKFVAKNGEFFAEGKADGASIPRIKNLLSDIAWGRAERIMESNAATKKITDLPPNHFMQITFLEKAKRKTDSLRVWNSGVNANMHLVQNVESDRLLEVGQSAVANFSEPASSTNDAVSSPDMGTKPK